MHVEHLALRATDVERSATFLTDILGRLEFASLPEADIRVYTGAMKVVKVRRVGNSNVISIPRELEARGFAPGTSVLVEEVETGELRIIPTEQVRVRIRDVGRRLVGEHAEALKILAEHDPAGGPAEP